MSTKKTTVVMIKPKNQKKRNNKTRSKLDKSDSSALRQLGQQRTVPISKTIQVHTVTKNMNHNFRFPKRREMVKTVVGTDAGEFVLESSIKLNPGDPSFSTWLVNIASNFEFYKFHYLKFFYIPRCATTTSGEVFLTPDMNSRDPAPITEEEACQNEKSLSSASWDHIVIDISKKMMSNQKSWRCRKNSLMPDGADQDLYDMGNLFVHVGGQPDKKKIGQLWVEYEIEFFNPEGNSTLPPSTMFARNTDGLSATSPILGTQTPNLVIEKTGDFIESITNDGTQDVIKFARDFHGILNGKVQGTTLGNTVLTGLNGASVNLSENGFTPTNYLLNGGQTFNSAQSLVNAPKGSSIGVKLASAASVVNSLHTLTNCYL